MDVDECLDAIVEFAHSLQPRKPRISMIAIRGVITRCDIQKVEEFLKILVRSRLENPNALMLESPDPSCKV